MATDLVKRICRLDPEDGGLPGSDLPQAHPDYDPAVAHISTQQFIGGLVDLAGGAHTVQQAYTAFNMPAGQRATYDLLISKIQGPDLATSMARIARFQSILTKWERREEEPFSGYDTVDDIETWLSAIDQTFTS